MSPRQPIRMAVRQLAVAEVAAHAAFAEAIGLTVVKEPGPEHATPVYVVTGPGGKEAALTLAGRDTPTVALVYRNPPRPAHGTPRTALIVMALPTVHRGDDPHEDAA